MDWPTYKWLWLWMADWRTDITTDCWLIDSLSERLTGNTPADVVRASTSRAPWLGLEGRGGAAWGAKRTSAWKATADWLTDRTMVLKADWLTYWTTYILQAPLADWMLIAERSTASWLANWFYKVPQARLTWELQPSSIDGGDGRGNNHF